MIAMQQIIEWKKQYSELYTIDILDYTFVFRPIGREEYKQIIIENVDLGVFQELLCARVVIYPKDYDFTTGLAGIAEVLSDAILKASGLLPGQSFELLQQYREEMENFDYQVDCVIHEAFPEFTLEEISTWSPKKTMYYLSRAEWILQNLKGVQIAYFDENQKQAMQQQEQVMQQTQQVQPQAPQPREIRKELTEFQQPEKPKQKPNNIPSGPVQSEEEVLAMLASTGMKVSNPITDIGSDVLPELNWFSYKDELTGEFDD